MKRNDRRALAVCMALTAAGALFPPAVLAADAQPPPEASGSPQSEQDVWKVLQDAQAQKEAGHCGDAIRLYTRVLASVPKLFSALRGRADCLAVAEQREAAVADYRELIRHWSGDSQSWGRLGWSLI